MKSKFLKISGITLLVLIAFVWSAPLLLKGKISRLVRTHISQDMKAHVNFSDVDISLFRHFPGITIGLDNVQVTCVGEFQGDTLVTAKQFDMACDALSIISGDSINVYSLTLNEPRFHAVIHRDGHANWNILKPDTDKIIDSSTRTFKLGIQRYTIHNGYADFRDERKNMHITVVNLEHEGRGNLSSDDLFTLKTKTTADAIDVEQNSAISYRVAAKTKINISFRVDNKSHTYSFNTDQVAFNDLKFHTEGFFQWINDSSYNMNIHFKVPSTKFKDFLSVVPSIYQQDFASIESGGQINFNGYFRGKYDDKHFPAYHTNFFVRNGSIKYPDLSGAMENINLGLQVDNPDGAADHTTVNISEAHAELNNETMDLHLLVKNLETKPFIDFGFVGKLDLANLSKCMKLEPGTHLSGVFSADIHAKGNLSENNNRKKDLFQSGGNVDLENFSFVSSAHPDGFTLSELLLTFNPKNILIKELKGVYRSTHIDATGTLNNLFDYALIHKPLNATIDLKTDEVNLREWIRTDRDSSAIASGHIKTAFEVPGNIDVSIHAAADKFHFDNLDLQNLSGNLLISNQTVQLHDVRANGFDGDLTIDGTYSTLESGENPEIALTYDAKGLDIQKTFFAFNSVRRIMPIAKFMAGSIDAHMTLNGRLNEDMTTDLQTLNGEGTVSLIAASLKDFGPLDKLSQSLDIAELKDIPLKDVKADFSYKAGKVDVSPFLVHAKDVDMEIGGSHGFDQSLDYAVKLKVPRGQLGDKGKVFVKNVVVQAADKGIPVKLRDAVSMDVKMSGTINSPDVKTDMDSEVNTAATDLKKEVNDFVNAKLDSAKDQLRNPSPIKKQLFVQANYKSRSHSKVKKTSSHKKATHTKSKKKKKKAGKHYTTSLKKEKSTASNSGKKRTQL